MVLLIVLSRAFTNLLPLNKRLIDLLPHPCTNKDRGCPVEELLTVLTSHETECRYNILSQFFVSVVLLSSFFDL